MNDLSRLLREAAEELGLSNRQLASITGLSSPTVDRMMNGTVAPKPANLDLVARALKIPVEQARAAAGRPRGEAGPYVPPEEARLLDDRQRRALDELIRAFVATSGGQQHGTAEQDQPEPGTQAGRPQHGRAGRAPRQGPMNKPTPLHWPDQGDDVDPTAPPPIRLWDAARSGTSEAERRRAVEIEPEDIPDPDGPEGGA